MGTQNDATVESGEDPIVGNVNPPPADVGRDDRGASREGLLPDEIAERDDSNVGHGGQRIKQLPRPPLSMTC